MADLLRDHTMEHRQAWRAEAGACQEALVDAERRCMRALAEVGDVATRTVCGATAGMPEMFAALEVLGAELARAGGPVKDGSLLPD